MNALLRLVPLLILAFVAVLPAQSVAATDEKLIAMVSAADDERQAATIAGDPARLEAIFSDELRYAHSSGKIDTKASYIDSLVSHQTVYESFEYRERTFLPVAPGIVLMSGRVFVHAHNGEQKVALDLNFLAVWREENGHWRFLAWQSCRNPAAVAAPAVK